MELTEKIETINNQLINLFGIDTISGQPIWRVVWSEYQFEKRLTFYTDSGIQLLRPEVRMLPKYKQWVQKKYVLERLTIVPEINQDELPTTKTSYEPMYVFENKHGQYLPPRLDVAKFIIDSMYAAQGKTSLAKYVEEEDAKEKRIDDLQEYLFSDETDVSDHLSRQTGVVVPSNYTKES